MRTDFVLATEALSSGRLVRRDLLRCYSKVYRNIYVRKGVELSAADRAYAAWLWSGRRAVLVGHSAAAILGSRWLPTDQPAELAHSRRPGPAGITVHTDRLADDDVCRIGPMLCTRPARTAYDMGRRLPLETAIIRIDALLNATLATVDDVRAVADRYPGARGIRTLRAALDLADDGAESPRETRLRLVLIRGGLPRPVTQIPVGVRRVDMGYKREMVGVEYDGEQHWTNPDIHAGDIERLEYLGARGWLIVRVSSRQLNYAPQSVVERVRNALAKRRAHA